MKNIKYPLWVFLGCLAMSCSKDQVELRPQSESSQVRPDGANAQTLPEQGELLTFGFAIDSEDLRVSLTDNNAPQFKWKGDAPVPVHVYFRKEVSGVVTEATATGALDVKGEGNNLSKMNGTGKPSFTVTLPSGFTKADLIAGYVSVAGAIGVESMDDHGVCKIGNNEVDVANPELSFPFYFPLTKVDHNDFVRTIHFHALGSVMTVDATLDDSSANRLGAMNNSLSIDQLSIVAGAGMADQPPFDIHGSLDLKTSATTYNAATDTYSKSADATWESPTVLHSKLKLKNYTIQTAAAKNSLTSPKIRFWMMPAPNNRNVDKVIHLIFSNRFYLGLSNGRTPNRAFSGKKAYRWNAVTVEILPNLVERWAKLNVGELNKFANGGVDDSDATIAQQQSGEGSRYYQFGRNVPFMFESHYGGPDRATPTADHSDAWDKNKFLIDWPKDGTKKNGSETNWYTTGASGDDTWTSIINKTMTATGAPSDEPEYKGTNGGDPSPEGYRLPTHQETQTIFPSLAVTSGANKFNVSEDIDPWFTGNPNDVSSYTTDYVHTGGADGLQYALKMKGTKYANAVRYRYLTDKKCLEIVAKNVLLGTTIADIQKPGFFTEDDHRIYLPALGAIGGEDGGISPGTVTGCYWTSTAKKNNQAYDWFFNGATGFSLTLFGRASAYTLRSVKKTP